MARRFNISSILRSQFFPPPSNSLPDRQRRHRCPIPTIPRALYAYHLCTNFIVDTLATQAPKPPFKPSERRTTHGKECFATCALLFVTVQRANAPALDKQPSPLALELLCAPFICPSLAGTSITSPSRNALTLTSPPFASLLTKSPDTHSTLAPATSPLSKLPLHSFSYHHSYKFPMLSTPIAAPSSPHQSSANSKLSPEPRSHTVLRTTLTPAASPNAASAWPFVSCAPSLQISEDTTLGACFSHSPNAQSTASLEKASTDSLLIDSFFRLSPTTTQTCFPSQLHPSLLLTSNAPTINRLQQISPIVLTTPNKSSSTSPVNIVTSCCRLPLPRTNANRLRTSLSANKSLLTGLVTQPLRLKINSSPLYEDRTPSPPFILTLSNSPTAKTHRHLSNQPTLLGRATLISTFAKLISIGLPSTPPPLTFLCLQPPLESTAS